MIVEDALLNIIKASGSDAGKDAVRDTEVVVDTTRLADRKLPVSVYVQVGSKGGRVLLARYDAYKEVVAYYGGHDRIPQNMRLGFSGSTGSGDLDGGGRLSLATTSYSILPGETVATPEAATVLLMLGGLAFTCVAAFRKTAKAIAAEPGRPQHSQG